MLSAIILQDLKEYMGKAGEVTFADAHKRRQGEGYEEQSYENSTILLLYQAHELP